MYSVLLKDIQTIGCVMVGLRAEVADRLIIFLMYLFAIKTSNLRIADKVFITRYCKALR
jgi:hypothetical protein